MAPMPSTSTCLIPKAPMASPIRKAPRDFLEEAKEQVEQGVAILLAG